MNQATQASKPYAGLTRPVVVSAVFCMLLTGLAYPAVTTLVANVLFPNQAQGSLVERDGKVIGSSVIGQHFTDAKYFQGRPSATMGPDPKDPSKNVSQPYNGGLSGASNQGPTNQKLLDDVKARAIAYRSANGLPEDARVPVDAVTASASGLDPEISIANARIQARRIAAQRKLPAEQVERLVEDNTNGRTFGILGEPRINVLQINLALDKLAPSPTPAPAASGQ
jgi:potassium-transporting ATPase KdpC subunit